MSRVRWRQDVPLHKRVAALARVGTLVSLQSATKSLAFFALTLFVFYAVSPAIGIRTLSPNETLDWTLAQDPQLPLTVLGVLFAYYFAVRSWKQQRRIELELTVSAEISSYLEEFGRSAHKLRVFADRYLALSRVEPGNRATSAAEAAYARSRVEEVRTLQHEVLEKSFEVYRLQGSYDVVLSQDITTALAVARATRAIELIADASWYDIPPPGELTDDGLFLVLGMMDARKWDAYIRVFEQNSKVLSHAASHLRTRAHSRLYGWTPVTLRKTVRVARKIWSLK